MTIRVRKIGAGGMYLKAVIYGHFGVGKTLLASTLALASHVKRALIVNIEGGGITAANIDGVEETEQLGSYADVQDVFWNLAHKTDDTEDGGVDWGSFDAVIVDSGSAVQDMNIMEVASTNATGSKMATQISQRDWGDSTRQVGELMRRFKALPLHVVVTARQRDGYPEGFDDAQKASCGPTVSTADFTPALRRHINHTFDHIWAMTADSDGQRFLLTQPNGTYQVKTRGIDFAQALDDVVTIKNPSDPDSEGVALHEILDLFIKTQGKNA